MPDTNLLQKMDSVAFGGFDVWEFSVRSLFRPYGRLFLSSVLLRYPRQTLRGLIAYRRRVRLARQKEMAIVGLGRQSDFPTLLPEHGWTVGMGFCEKPLDPPCPSGRFNHRCWLLEQPGIRDLPRPCMRCHVREISRHLWATGGRLYIMTSAEDIARDLLLPALRSSTGSYAVLSVCPFSIPPLTLAMTICQLYGWVLPYGRGYCCDFAAWTLADRGEKPEQTSLQDSSQQRLIQLLDRVINQRKRRVSSLTGRFKPAGHFYVPVY